MNSVRAIQIAVATVQERGAVGAIGAGAGGKAATSSPDINAADFRMSIDDVLRDFGWIAGLE